MKAIPQYIFNELKRLNLLKVLTSKNFYGKTEVTYKNFRITNEGKKSKHKTYYIEHHDFTEEEYENMKKQGRKSPNILDKYYEIIGSKK